MGGVATALDLRLEEGAGRLEPRGILLLLDRADDEFIARRSGADGWIVKPLDSLAIRRGMQAVLAPASS
jgi:AmiR/NasT family two-component response regulator